ncbi:unnamed protein product [Kuraishia capsulata CBS 1993]|uniref:Uncharacterized protein n=1 Tax=Kuraishia capsulata CBS 1993 TaxID=1382522 RepID=W6MKD6_9ASCO|nr:uncharacterized protein KUCA_T00002790001 [Kuraishia capsulata CBS 1993]CDK26816.1 unnamed protein product [Kuraishia capsulata CBS 1993]
MGVTGLLPLLKAAQVPCSLEDYRGKTLAVDSYAWLHKAVFSCAMELVRDQPTQKYISYMMRRIDMLRHFGIEPYMVFDGDYLPTKAGTEKERAERRREYKALAETAVRKNDKKTAFGCFQKACDVTPEMAKSLIDVLNDKGIKYVVAPYEADSQMVHLEKLGIVDGIISEDSDLLVFGCKLLITKLNDKGECVEVKRDNFSKCKATPINTFTEEQMRTMAILSGCDYSKGISGIGVSKAFWLIKKYHTIERILLSLKMEGKYTIPENFVSEYRRASLAFQYQLVFNVKTGKVQSLNELPAEGIEESTEELALCAGNMDSHDIHKAVAMGLLNPMTKQPLHSRETSLTGKTTMATPAVRSATTTESGSAVRNVFRTFSTPTPNRGSIDSFFTKTPDLTTVQSVRKLSPQKSMKLSPVSKRKKILFGTNDGKGTLSSFFTPNTTSKTGVMNTNMQERQLQETPSRKPFATPKSDDYNITDLDDDDVAEISPVTRMLPIEVKETVVDLSPSVTSPKSEDLSELEDSPVRSRKQSEVAAVTVSSLKEKFALKPITNLNLDNVNLETSTKAQPVSRTISLTTHARELSLQSFAYRP